MAPKEIPNPGALWVLTVSNLSPTCRLHLQGPSESAMGNTTGVRLGCGPGSKLCQQRVTDGWVGEIRVNDNGHCICQSPVMFFKHDVKCESALKIAEGRYFPAMNSLNVVIIHGILWLQGWDWNRTCRVAKFPRYLNHSHDHSNFPSHNSRHLKSVCFLVVCYCRYCSRCFQIDIFGCWSMC